MISAYPKIPQKGKSKYWYLVVVYLVVFRPSADKLMQHPFFKQAKRREYLARTILTELPPLEQRPRKKIPQKQIIITKSDEWDFDIDQEDDSHDELDHNNIPEQILVPTLQPQDNMNKRNNSVSSKKHISFGDVIVRSNSLVHPSDSSIGSSSPPPPISSTPPRKSRFVIEETTTDTLNSSSIRSSSPSTEDDHHTTTSDQIMKGRFYVNQQQQKTTEPDEEADNATTHSDKKSRFEVSSMYQPIPLSRDSSSYSSTSTAGGKKPLYHQLQHSSTQDYLTAENVALLTESSRKIGRFELTSSGSSSVDVTPRGSISDHHHPHSLQQQLQQHQLQQHQQQHHQEQIEELLRMNESQRALLQEISFGFKKTGGGGAPMSAQTLSTQNTHNNQPDYFYEQ